MTFRDEKYIVFKREDWDEFVRIHGGNSALELPDDIADSVVLRLHDMLATPAIWAYVHSVQATLEILDAVQSTYDIRHLEDIRDYFHDAAHRALQLQGQQKAKLPD